MWPFRSKKTVEDTTVNERLVRMEKRIDRLEEDWTEVYGKFRTLQMRVAKQVQRLDKDSSQEEPQGAEGDGGKGTSLLTSSLSPRLQRIQNEILERRRRGPLAKEGGE
jgi:phage shock protein A